MNGAIIGLLLGNSLTRLIFLPALACLPLLLFKRSQLAGVKVYALCVGIVEVLVTLTLILPNLDPARGFIRLQDLDSAGEPFSWIEMLGIRYDVAMDGISMPLVLLTVILLPIVVAASWNGVQEHWRAYAMSLFILTTGILGALVAMDLFLFYVFWEVMLIPMYMIIGIWGGPRRIYAAVKFFLFTMAGSLLMLIAIIWMAWTYRELSGYWSFAYEDLLRLNLPMEPQMWLFGAFALAFAIKVPMVPLHTWLPDAHVEAPTGGSVVLAGVLLKLGTYGFLRFALPFFPHASVAAAPLLIALALVGIIYGSLVAWVQSDMKKLVAYSSVAHLGFVMLGIFALDLVAWQGALIQMVNHGLSTGALFLLVGMLYERRHTRAFDEFGGLAKPMPFFAFFLVFATLASMGLPALNGFVGEFLILTGTYRAGLPWAAIVGSFGVVLAAVYLLKMLARTLWGPITRDENRELPDLSLREIAILVPLSLLMLAIGLVPEAFLAPSRPALQQTLSRIESKLANAPVAPTQLITTAPSGQPRVRVRR